MFIDPSHIISQFDLQSGARVADFGAGTGTLSVLLAHAVGDKGKVYAIEVQKGLLDRLKNHTKEARVHNVEALWGDIERINGTHLKDASVDAVVVSNVLFQVDDKAGLTAEAKRILIPRGKVLLIDWTESFGGMGPHKTAVVTEKAGRELFENGGFTFVKKIEAGQHHYGMIFRKS